MISLKSLVRLAMALLFTLMVAGEAIAQEPPTFPIRLNAGTDQAYTDHRGIVYAPEQAWTPETGIGYIGGYPVYGRFASGGTPDKILYENQRRNWQEYRFSGIPNGDYLVTLRFSEIAVFDDFGPCYTIFDVAIEDQTVLDDFNIFARVGGNYALTRRFPVTVNDGELNVVATPVFGESRLAAIEVDAHPPEAIAPAVPVDLTAAASYDAVLLDWAESPEEDLDGYHVYRAGSPDGPYVRLTDEPVHISRYQDVVTTTHRAYYYRVRAVDVYGNESEWPPHRSAAALDEGDATLPFFHLDLAPESLLALYDDPWSNATVEGSLTYDGLTFPVQVRYRGNWGRYHNKKSWKVEFTDLSPFPDQDEINLRADYLDPSMMRSKLATELFEAAGIRPGQAEHVLLALNGEYVGVYTLAEQVDAGFLKRTGRDPGTSIYKAVETDDMDFSSRQPSEEAYRAAFEKKTNRDTDYSDIIALIELVNDTPDETFAYELGRVFDVAQYLDYYALIILTGNDDFSSHNAYLLHDLTTDRWELVPYDLDWAFHPVGSWHELPVDGPIDKGTPGSPIWGWVTNLLLTRVLDVPQFRAYYCHRLAEFTDTIFSDEAMSAMIDATYARIEQDGLRDWRKHGWETNDWFTASPGDLKAYVAGRGEYVRSKMPAYCPAEQPYLSINEVMTAPPQEGGGLGGGEFPAWFEIYNRGLEPVDLSGLFLTDDLSETTKFQITEGITIPANGFVTFYADGEPEQGPFHTSFQLARTGGQMRTHYVRGIFSGTRQIDGHTFGLQQADVSEGRFPDGVDNWRPFNVPTPGDSNLLRPPVVSGATRVPLLPTASDAVTVTATITDDGTLLAATLYYSATGSGFVDVPMTGLGVGGYAAPIPPQPDGTLVAYYLAAEDDDGGTGAAPSNAPDGVYEYVVGYQSPRLFINEVMAKNETVLSDPDEPGEFPDWIELYNPGPAPVDLGGRYLTDDLNDPLKFRIASGTVISPGGFLIFYADDDPEQGNLHTNFRLSRNGGSVGLFDLDAAGNQAMDTSAYGPQAADVSEGRCLDTWMAFTAPTPGAVNGPSDVVCSRDAGPAILKVRHAPLFPSATDTVTVTAVVVDDRPVLTVTLWYSTAIAPDFVPIAMLSVRDNVYAASVPAIPEGILAAYYVQAGNDRGLSVTDPLRAPLRTHRYLVGYRPAGVCINEFMANNVTTLEDPDDPGEFPDWIELYNPGPVPIDLGGKYLTDDLRDPTKFRIVDGLTIPAGGFVLFYADGEPEQGVYHANFRLNQRGESIGLFDGDATGNQPIDTYTFGPQAGDVSERRYPDGGADWMPYRTPTPGSAGVTPLYLPVVSK